MSRFERKNKKPIPEIIKLDHIPCPRCGRKGGITVQNNIWHCSHCDAEG